MTEFEALRFGNVTRYKNKEYIFLAKTPDTIYLAQILSEEDSTLLKAAQQKLECKGGPGIERKLKAPLFCYIILKTSDFKGRAAHFGNAGQDGDLDPLDKLNLSLDPRDLKGLKKEVLASPINAEMKNLVDQVSL